MVTIEECAERMGRTAAEIEQLVYAGVIDAVMAEGEILRVRPILLSGPRF